MKNAPILAALWACLFLLAPVRAQPATQPVTQEAPNLPQQVRDLAGQVVRIDFDVDVDGRGPSVAGTQYLLHLLRSAGAKPFTTENSPPLEKNDHKVRVLILGEIRPELTVPPNADDPLQVEIASRKEKLQKDFEQIVAQRKAEASAAGVRVILPGELRQALGLNITHLALLTDSYHLMAQEAERRFPEINWDGVALGDVLDFLEDVSGVSIKPDSDALSAAGVELNTPITSRLKDITLLQALKEIAGQCHNKVAIISDGATIVFTSKEDAARRTAKKNSIWFTPEQWATVVLAPQPTLDGPLSVLRKHIPAMHLEGVALQDVLDFYHDLTRVKIDPDWVALQPAGIAKDSPVKQKLSDAAFGQLLLATADALGYNKCAFYITPDAVIHLTTPAKAQAAVKQSAGKAILIDEALMR